MCGDAVAHPVLQGASDEGRSKCLEAPLHTLAGRAVHGGQSLLLFGTQLLKRLLVLPIKGLCRETEGRRRKEEGRERKREKGRREKGKESETEYMNRERKRQKVSVRESVTRINDNSAQDQKSSFQVMWHDMNT